MSNKLYPGSIKCQKPKMSSSKATWDSCIVVGVDGKEIEGYLDTTWGHYFYFNTEDGWRKAKIDQFMSGSENKAIFKYDV